MFDGDFFTFRFTVGRAFLDRVSLLFRQRTRYARGHATFIVNTDDHDGDGVRAAGAVGLIRVSFERGSLLFRAR